MNVAIMGCAGQSVCDKPTNHAPCQLPMQSRSPSGYFSSVAVCHLSILYVGLSLLFHLRQDPKNREFVSCQVTAR